ncbi:MAG: LysM peptidoglycan-binding domain-containing protein [Neobacillus sp.]
MQVFYTVRPGDTLYQIANRWKLPVDSLIAANNLAPPYTIFVGQQLSVPPGVDVYLVKPGDSVYTIAQFFGVPQTIIIEANQLQPPYTIQENQLLKVPPGNPYYVVQPGDTLYQIARRFNVTTTGQNNFEFIRQVNQLPSYHLFPGMKLIIPYAPPGDLGLIAYTSNRAGTGYDIWIYHPSNGANVQLTSGLGESFSNPFWSPDSRHIAFIGRNGILFIINLVDGSVARIDQLPGGEGVYLDWSPDSQKLVYVKENQIIMYHVITHQIQRIPQPGATDVQWFPNGTELLFQVPDALGVSQLFRIQTDGANKRQITQNTGGRYNHVRLSPDGRFILYTTPGASISLVFILELTTGRLIEVKGGPLAKNYFPAWTPDSQNIAYSATAFEDVGYFSLIRTVERQGGNDRTRAISNCFATPVTWSADGRKIAYLSGCNGQGAASEIWVLDVLNPVPIRIIAGARVTNLQWSPTAAVPFKKTLTNTELQVQLQYPGHWQKVNEERAEGTDGFLQIAAIFSEKSLNTVCQNEAFHQLLPYGTKPQISSTTIQNQEGCFIYPSEDQPAEMRGQAALIVRYPQPIQIGTDTYNFFILWADQNHIKEIASTIKFL